MTRPSNTVALVFPPLVNTGFGAYYPSTAVLAGYLQALGFDVLQANLNELLVLHLLEPATLAALADGGLFPGKRPLAPESSTSVAARILAREGHRLFDAAGRHRFAEDAGGPAYLLKALAQHVHVDLPIADVLDALDAGDPLLDHYERFYAATGYAASLDGVGLVGISAPMGPQIAPSLVLARHLKAARPGLRVVIGGPAVSLMGDDALAILLARAPYVDAVVRFDGELPFVTLAEQRRQGAWRPEEVPGVSCVADGRVVHVPPGRGLALKALPAAAYDAALLGRLVDPELGLVQTRGCYWGRCTYCDFVELYKGSPAFRNRPAESFVDEMQAQMARHGVSRFGLITEAIPPAFARRFASLVLERGLAVRWSSFAMVDGHFDHETFTRMRESGCESLIIGLETMNDRVLALVRKAATAEANVRFLRAAAGAGIRLNVNLIPDLPTTTYAEALATLDALDAVRDCLHGVAVFPFEPTRSSQVGRDPGRFGLTVLPDDRQGGQSEYASNHLPSVDPAMTPEERAEVHARYRRFADGIAAARNPRAPVTASGRLRVDASALDVVRLPDGSTQICNWKLRETWRAPPGWHALIGALSGAPFERSAFTTRFGASEVGTLLLRALLDHGVVTEAA